MNDRIQKLIDQAVKRAPEGILCAEAESDEIPEGHTHALVEHVEDMESGFVRVLATGDESGIAWALGHAAKYYETQNELEIIEAEELESYGPPIEFH